MCNCYIFACVSTSGKSCSCFKPFPVESQYEGEWLIEGYNKRRSIVQSKFLKTLFIYCFLYALIWRGVWIIIFFNYSVIPIVLIDPACTVL